MLGDGFKPFAFRCLAQVEDVFVLAVPQSSFGSGVDAANAAAIRQQERERARSQKMYLLRQAEVLKSLADASEIPAEGEKGFVHKLTEKILSNLQLTVKRIHIRFEDNLTFPQKPFSFGFRVDEVRTFSVDERGEEGYFVPTADAHGAILTRKRVFMRNAALYWDSRPELWQSLPFNKLIERFARTFTDVPVQTCLLADRHLQRSPCSSLMSLGPSVHSDAIFGRWYHHPQPQRRRFLRSASQYDGITG